MFVLSQLPNNDFKFIIYDKKEVNLDDFSIEKIKDIDLSELESDYANLPILEFNQFLLRTLKPKERTDNHILSELRIETFNELKQEKTRIDAKVSKLSHSQRELVINRYNEIVNSFQ